MQDRRPLLIPAQTIVDSFLPPRSGRGPDRPPVRQDQVILDRAEVAQGADLIGYIARAAGGPQGALVHGGRLGVVAAFVEVAVEGSGKIADLPSGGWQNVHGTTKSILGSNEPVYEWQDSASQCWTYDAIACTSKSAPGGFDQYWID